MIHVLYSRFTGLWRVCTLHSPLPLWGIYNPFSLLPALLIFQEAYQMPLLLFILPCFTATFKQLTAINALKMHPLIPLHKHLFIFLDFILIIEESQIYKYTNMGGRKCDAMKRQIQGPNPNGIYMIWENLIKLSVFTQCNRIITLPFRFLLRIRHCKACQVISTVFGKENYVLKCQLLL